MIVLSRLSSPSLAQLQRALPPPHVVANTSSWEHLVAEARLHQYDVVIVDPCLDNEHLAVPRLRDLKTALALEPTRPVIAYVSVSAASMRAVHALSRLGPHDVVIRGVDDSPNAIANAVGRALATSAATGLIGSMDDSLRALPPNLAAAIERMFHCPEHVPSVSALASSASTTRRSLDRWLARVRLAPARTLLACARANAAFQIITAGPVARRRAAALVGYTSARALTRELQALTGWSTRSALQPPTKDEFAAALSRHLLRCREPTRAG